MTMRYAGECAVCACDTAQACMTEAKGGMGRAVTWTNMIRWASAEACCPLAGMGKVRGLQ